ncbi:uncharacterized protein TEOVI_000563700 [Trypanosoma equiperdum]|uniref:Uncharacterized protein n=1 Tax=Trypanosoma equiperdum TaxID=5694 RepID=A0A1G4I2I4_TRYEQ|nr:hypothetical protein TEOVI_000563700 [Trypanosoma equiperdum]
MPTGPSLIPAGKSFSPGISSAFQAVIAALSHLVHCCLQFGSQSRALQNSGSLFRLLASVVNLFRQLVRLSDMLILSKGPGTVSSEAAGSMPVVFPNPVSMSWQIESRSARFIASSSVALTFCISATLSSAASNNRAFVSGFM